MRLNNFGAVAIMPPSNRGQSPKFNKISAHYIELAPDSLTAVGSGKRVYLAAETSLGGSPAINFSQSIVVAEGQEFFSLPLSEVTGTYKWLRVSLGYQNYDIR